MDKSETPEPIITSLNEKQKKAVIEDLAKRGLSLTWDQLQDLVKTLPPDTKIADIQKAIREQNNSHPK